MTAPALDRAPRVVEWYRPSVAPHLRRVLVPASSLMLVGSILWAHGGALRAGRGAVLARTPPPPGATTLQLVPPTSLELALMVGGFALCVAGGLLAILGLLRTMRQERYLALRTDGALWHVDGEETLLGWDDLARVRWDAGAGALVFERRDGAAPFHLAASFHDLPGPDLARRLDDVRRKAVWNLL